MSNVCCSGTFCSRDGGKFNLQIDSACTCASLENVIRAQAINFEISLCSATLSLMYETVLCKLHKRQQQWLETFTVVCELMHIFILNSYGSRSYMVILSLNVYFFFYNKQHIIIFAASPFRYSVGHTPIDRMFCTTAQYHYTYITIRGIIHMFGTGENENYQQLNMKSIS